MPAEWTPHASTWLAWPHDDEQWIGMLEPVRREFAPFVDAIARHDSVDLIVADEESERDAKRRLDLERDPRASRAAPGPLAPRQRPDLRRT